MVRIDGDYLVSADYSCYTLYKDQHRRDKKGEPTYSAVGYYKNMRAALASYIHRKVVDSLCVADEIDLDEAAARIDGAMAQAKAIVEHLEDMEEYA